MGHYKISIETKPRPGDINELTDELANYTESLGLSPEVQPLAVFLRSRLGRIAGGVYGVTYWGLFWVQLVWVEEELRGQGHGTELLRVAEREALGRGCRIARLETFAAGSCEFYRRLGYEVFGELRGHPPGHTTFFMKKSDLTQWGATPGSVTADA